MAIVGVRTQASPQWESVFRPGGRRNVDPEERRVGDPHQ